MANLALLLEDRRDVLGEGDRLGSRLRLRGPGDQRDQARPEERARQLTKTSRELRSTSTRGRAVAVAVRGTSPNMPISPITSLRVSVFTSSGPLGVGTVMSPP